ncbi:MAG: peptidoglycan-binding protein [Candidatus Pacebacteria bacterium]|nr:peptidoglycan-binding protein [Candidatus Paceibacterota bacterium]
MKKILLGLFVFGFLIVGLKFSTAEAMDSQITLTLGNAESVFFNGQNLELKLQTLDDSTGIYGLTVNGVLKSTPSFGLELPITDSVSLKGISYSTIYSGAQSVTLQLIEKINPYLTVTSPNNGGESVEAGGKIEIRWVYPNVSTSIEIYISDGIHKGHTAIVRMENGVGGVIYTLDSNLIPGSNYKAYVSTVYGSAVSDSDSSDYPFTIKSSVDLGCNGTTYSSTTGQACPEGTVTPSITVLSPKGGETYIAGQQITVKWESKNVVASIVGIMLVDSNNLTTATTIVYPTLNDGIETITLPEVSGQNFKIFITNDQTGGAYSNTFKIVKLDITPVETETPSVTVLSPNGGEIYKQGAPIAISLSGGLYLTRVGLVYPDFDPNKPISDGNSVYWLHAATDAGKSYVWDGLSYEDQSGWRAGTGNYKILAIRGDYGIKCDPISNCAYDISDNYFTIKSSVDLGCNGTTYSSTTGQACPSETINPKITVLSPNGGENIKMGDKYNITWESRGPLSGNNVSLSLKKEGVSCSPTLIGCQSEFSIANNIVNQGSYVWDTNLKMSGSSTGPNSISVTPGAQYRIGVCGLTIGACDYSDAVFTIKPAVDTTVDHGCSAGQNYSSTTGKPCSTVVIKDDSCMHGYNFSPATGKACSGYTTVNTYQPASSINAATPIQRTLRIGIRGDDVKRLQEFLNLLADGSFGPKTAAKVKEWQAANGLTSDGLFGRQSLIKAGLTD